MELCHREYEPFCQEDAEEERKNFLSVFFSFLQVRMEKR